MMQKKVTRTLREQTQQLLDGPLKHIRGAALAAALLPLASVAATSASAQTVPPCPSGGTCGIVFNDTNGNGILDVGETPLQEATVTACVLCNGTDNLSVTTDLNGVFVFPSDAPLPPTFSLYVLIPTGTQASPIGPDNVGSSNGSGFSVAKPVLFGSVTNNFGFTPTSVPQPGTGTPGYWKNHPEAWPVSSITIGPNNTYTVDQAIGWLSSTGKDKSVTMFQSYVAAYLSIQIGNDGSCVNQTMSDAYDWLVSHPVGSKIGGGSAEWAIGQPIQSTLDAYDNGLLCAPHRK
jgi:hypothetical protein